MLYLKTFLWNFITNRLLRRIKNLKDPYQKKVFPEKSLICMQRVKNNYCEHIDKYEYAENRKVLQAYENKSRLKHQATL